VPPKLDYHPPEPADLRRSWVLELLDHTSSPACVLDGQGMIQTVNDLWHEQIAKAVRPDLAECAATNGNLLNLFADEPQRSEFQKGLTMPAEGAVKPFVATADLGTPARPFVVRLHVQPLPPEDEALRVLVQAQDITPEHVVRFALLDRERKLRDARLLVQEQTQKLQQQEADLQNLSAQQEAALQSLTETQKAEIENLAEQHKSELQSAVEQHQLDMKNAAEQRRAAVDNVISERDEAALELLSLFSVDPQNFTASFCRMAAATAQSSALLIEFDNEGSGSKTLTQVGPLAEAFTPADQPWLPFFQTVWQEDCAVKFDHLTSGDDRAFWLERGVGCVWAFPLHDEATIARVLLLLFPEEDAPLPVELYARLNAWSQIAALLLYASQAFIAPQMSVAAQPEPPVIPVAETVNVPADSSHLRILTAGLAEEYGNLLTGVLGHSSLAAAELGENHTALGDVRAIEKAARGAAQLTRRLLAISGAPHRAQASLDLTSYLKHYIQHDHAGVALQTPDEPCPVHAEATSLEIILDGLCDHVRVADGMQWNLQTDDNHAALTVSCAGSFAPPAGWENGVAGSHLHGGIPEIFFAREAAHALGGDVSITTHDDRTDLCLTLPLVVQKISS
jgi:hypothetical protein